MERRAPREETSKIVLPQQTLIVLCGPAGAGKSTFAHAFIAQHQQQGCKLTTIVSSDQCRALICDDESNQQANRDTFDLFYYIINKRLFQGRLTIADSTALQTDARQRLLDLAQRHSYHTCLLIFNMSQETCLRHNQQAERGRVVESQVISYHVGLLSQVLHSAPQEGWDEIHVLDEQYTQLPIIIQPASVPPADDTY